VRWPCGTVNASIYTTRHANGDSSSGSPSDARGIILPRAVLSCTMPSSAIILCSTFLSLWTVTCYPTYYTPSNSSFPGRLIQYPDPNPENGLKQIPDDDHPFIAPGPGDMRGPCPALNTLANHGYLPRDGVATPEQIFMAVTEGFNLGVSDCRLQFVEANKSSSPSSQSS
jgi:hypothetical protein